MHKQAVAALLLCHSLALAAPIEIARTFRNERDESVTLYWLNDQGEPHEIKVLEPHTSQQLNTYEGHRFIMTNAAKAVVGEFVISSSVDMLVVTMDGTVKRPTNVKNGFSNERMEPIDILSVSDSGSEELYTQLRPMEEKWHMVTPGAKFVARPRRRGADGAPLLSVVIPNAEMAHRIRRDDETGKVTTGLANDRDVPVDLYLQLDPTKEGPDNEIHVTTVRPKEVQWRPTWPGQVFLAREAGSPETVGKIVIGDMDGVRVVKNVPEKDMQALCARGHQCSVAAVRLAEAVDVTAAMEENRRLDGERRAAQNRDQPRTVRRYTPVGYKKMRVPDKAWGLLSRYWADSGDQWVRERWHADGTAVNHWQVPSYMVHLPEPWSGSDLKKLVFTELQETLETWCKTKLQYTDMYGIRVYINGSVLQPHVDRLPTHIVSAIINVAQDVNTPWLLEVYNHEGVATNVSMVPGDLVLYESARAIHGRPIPLDGAYFANVFAHYRPVDGRWQAQYDEGPPKDEL